MSRDGSHRIQARALGPKRLHCIVTRCQPLLLLLQEVLPVIVRNHACNAKGPDVQFIHGPYDCNTRATLLSRARSMRVT